MKKILKSLARCSAPALVAGFLLAVMAGGSFAGANDVDPSVYTSNTCEPSEANPFICIDGQWLSIGWWGCAYTSHGQWARLDKDDRPMGPNSNNPTHSFISQLADEWLPLFHELWGDEDVQLVIAYPGHFDVLLPSYKHQGMEKFASRISATIGVGPCDRHDSTS